MMALDDKTKQALEEQIKVLRSEVEALREAKTETETKSQELRLTHLRQEIKIDQLRKEINELTADNETLCDAYNEVNRINTTLRTNYIEVSVNNADLRNNLATLNANIDEWEKYALRERDHSTKLNSYTDHVEKRLEKSETRTKALEERDEDLEQRNEDLEDRLVIERIEMQALEAEYKELERTNEALWSTIKYLDDLVDEDQAEVMRMRKGVMKLKKLWELGILD
jgi:chromosome segregation ATPase